MRRKDREMDQQFAYGVLDRAPYATISMVRPDGSAYGIPISIVREEDHFYFHSAMEGEKIDSLVARPEICVSAVSRCRPVKDRFTMEYESAVIFGKAVMVEDDEEKVHGLRLLCQRFCPENMAEFDVSIARSLKRTAVIRVDISSVTGKRKKYDKEGKEMKWGRME
ncbi:pyridoxamine 5'-phosphate oxidase family protein [Anaerotignum lactatifermentans]|uniref:Pyridoxamine 5'-phosphate oxidase family protein n=1 Tax=Anaerotignum lactatifermentans TaxID=160404 RepID=A0ABS2G932_9FIRM|nr:pyridoxamine 5'-phosphate oxidase family protein [Anaerotignum lactatifermentans]MBM6828818.1 pyridoxamine 5'-phosphate oxidase family protein [Anaerotignum lactatifermentans]MBM6877009.1 pyridoxamine 5'-phosphate oxidase family protein [Anaerotignum lactatifermentans]MBM6950567.1 pyridoxamine 5'-phosphate oxidase family protein [Anaerotignum lactatifermentans]